MSLFPLKKGKGSEGEAPNPGLSVSFMMANNLACNDCEKDLYTRAGLKPSKYWVRTLYRTLTGAAKKDCRQSIFTQKGLLFLYILCLIIFQRWRSSSNAVLRQLIGNGKVRKGSVNCSKCVVFSASTNFLKETFNWNFHFNNRFMCYKPK